MFMVTFRHGEDVDKNSDDGFITLLSDSEFDKKKDFESGSVCANFLFAFLSHLGITQNKKRESRFISQLKWIRPMESDINGFRLNDVTILPLGC